MGKKYTTHTISIGDHNLDAPVMVQINALIADGLHSEAGYLTEESGTTRLTDAQIAEMGYIKTYTDTDTNTQLTDAQIAEMGYIKTYTDTDTNTQLTSAQIAAMGYTGDQDLSSYHRSNGETYSKGSGNHMNLKHTTAGGYSEFSMSNDSNEKLVIGSIGSGYTSTAWAGSRYIYSTAGELRIKAATNLRLYSGGHAHTGNLAVTFDSNQDAVFTGNISAANLSGTNTGDQTAAQIQALGMARFYNNAVLNSSTTTATFIAELISDYGCFANNQVTLKVQWSYAGSSNLVTGHATIGTIELAGCTIETWGGSYKHVRISRPNTGTGGHMVVEYNDQSSSYAPGWREIWTSESDGAGSGLDADLLDGQQGDYYYPASNPNNYITTDWTTDQGDTNIHSGNYTDTDTNTQLTDAEITEMGYIKTYTDTDTNTQLTSAEIAAMGYTSNTGTLTSSNDRNYITDTRGAQRAPSYYNDRYAQWDFQNSADTTVGGDGWHALLTVSKWGNWHSSHRQEQLIFSGDHLWRRTATSDTVWGTNKKIWDSGNLTNNSANWNEAHGWGNHADEGYLTSYTDTDTNTQLTTAQIAAMGYIKENEDRRHKVLRFTGEGSNSNNGVINYGIYQEGGGWSSPFPDLVIGYHTGIKIGGAQGYNGTRFYSDAPGRTGAVELMSVGNGDGDVRVTNVAHAGNSFRAPYFYSPGDTTYFLDPASSSVLFSVSAQHFYGNLTGNASTATTATTATIASGVSETGYGSDNFTFWQTSGAFAGYSGWANYYIGNHGNGSTYYNTTHIMPFWGAPKYSRLTGGSQSAVYDYWTSEGVINSTHDIKAPVFYDSNSTSYYMDPSNSNIAANFSGGIQMVGNYGVGITGKYTSTRLQTIFNMGTSYKLPNDGLSTSNAYGLYWSHQNAGATGGANNLASHGLIILEAGNYKGSWGGGRIVTTESVRAPAFYDSNNTAYVVNPASTSTFANINAANFYGTLTGTASNANLLDNIDSTQFMRSDVTDTFFPGGTSALAVENQGTFTRLAFNELRFYEWDSGGDNLILNNGHVSSDSSFRAPIFYDSNNTGYYTNPASDSIMNRVKLINNTTPIIIKVNSNYKTWVHHIASDDTYVFAPSTANGGETWDWNNQMSINTSGVVTANNFVLRSDERSKTKIKNLTRDNIDVSWKSFEMKGNEGDYRTGVIAQELEETHPEFVNTDSEGFKSVKYIDLLIAKIAELEARLEKLEK